MIYRREILFGGALCLLFTQQALCGPHYRGCRVSGQTMLRGMRAEAGAGTFHGMRMFGTSGDRDFDFALAHTLSYLSDLFNVLPGFSFIEDNRYRIGNAIATSDNLMDRADGTVGFGVQLLRTLFAEPEHPEVHVAGVCAHEFAHIAQFKFGAIERLDHNQPTVKRSELHADFLAGYFAGMRRLQRPSFPAAVVAQAKYNLGDTAVDNPNHHGTPEERGRAAVEGFKAAFDRRLRFGEAFETGIRYALRQ